jgi:Dolichyl-phosphate-mannose-protein mannosyltransferase
MAIWIYNFPMKKLPSISSLSDTKHKSTLSIMIPLTLSAFIHLWNPIGFPNLNHDEGVYMGRAMHVAVGRGPQETSNYYDHPYFGQLVLAGALKLIGYPHLFNCCPTGTANGPSVQQSIEILYIIPRVLMGVLAIVDTFLIYKISERRYNNRNVAFIASILFAVMPLTWLLRWILLDTIQLPLILSSILFAMYAKDFSEHSSLSKNKKNLTTLVSGIFLGLAIFTKIPAFVVIPMIGFLLYKGNHRNTSTIALWLIPVILIPMIWPAHSMTVGKFNEWLKTVVAQTQRSDRPLFAAIQMAVIIDPLLVVAGACGLCFAATKRDFFLLLWSMPYLVFLYIIGWVSVFHLILIIPAFCIAGSEVIVQLSNKIVYRKRMRQLNKNLFPWITISFVGIFGFTSTFLLITKNVSSSQFEAAAFVSEYLRNNDESYHDITLVSNPVYSWIFTYVYNKDHVFPDYRGPLFAPIQTEMILLIADAHFKADIRSAEKLQKIYNNTNDIATFNGDVLKYDHDKYPYTSMSLNYEGSKVEVRIGKQKATSPG